MSMQTCIVCRTIIITILLVVLMLIFGNAAMSIELYFIVSAVLCGVWLFCMLISALFCTVFCCLDDPLSDSTPFKSDFTMLEVNNKLYIAKPVQPAPNTEIAMESIDEESKQTALLATNFS
eukprot:TRINITY_DN23428_c0_g1_i1.p3 TRINITY_DN23428_c0_g1~~TRINITY_DN23428_c0_g1_i1.p3  ORF type:complete len:121 (+),score=3.34 TRINITY_DN23428_c0_g1_i1:253-615(+)